LELLFQTGGEFNERFEDRNLTIITKLPPASVYIQADGRQLYRAIENLYANAAKYAMENTTIYVELMPLDKIVVFTIKNIMDTRLQIAKNSYEDLTERFVRGEVSRTTEGSGLGLSIAKSLTTLMGGTFHIMVDKDTFTARITFPLANNN
jgi:signal transduction histidine kinase